MLDSIYHMALKYFEFGLLRKNAKILLYICDVITGVNRLRYQNLQTTSVL